MILALTGSQLYADPNETPPPIPSQEEPEVLNKGPIHEAFAQPVETNPNSGIVTPNEPPADIRENPSKEKPKGSGYIWIPGYWAWNPDWKDYIWVSGCWREPPANMSWIPGYWHQVPGGWQWIAGFWTPSSLAGQIEYLPEPPELTDVEPPVNSTPGDNIWVPPCYYWLNNQYILRSGYWLVPHDNWIWTPSHYTWTPYGYVFVPGYWDRALTTRGILYAPVYFPRRFYNLPGYTYSLGVIVDIGNLQFSLFSYPRYCHYYFGDYYSDFYSGLGIYPWFEFETRHGWYDPIFAYDRWHYRGTIPHWSDHIRREYALRRTDRSLRPPTTYRELETRFSKIPARQRENYRMVEPLGNFVGSKSAPFKFSRMSNRQHERILSHTDEIHNFRQERRLMETGPQHAPEVIQRQGVSGTRERIITESRPSTPGRTQQQAVPESRSQTIGRAREQASPERIPQTSGRSRQQAVPERRPEIPGRTREQASPERIPQTSGRTMRQATPEGRPQSTGRTQEQTRSARSSQSQRPSQRMELPERRGFSNRNFSERMGISRSPISGRSSGGLFHRSTPSRPDGERNFNRRESRQSRERQSSQGGRGGR